jgi:pyruvate,orthophosphate dikinase
VADVARDERDSPTPTPLPQGEGAHRDPSPACHFILPGEPLPAGGAQEVGNKAWNLMRMARAGLRVPPGFVLTTAWYRALRDGTETAESLRAALAAGIARLEQASGLGFGSARRPLLVSVRSGAPLSMPGMLETVLNVGLSPATVEGLIRLTGNPRLAWDSYRRFVQSYAEVVAGLPTAAFDSLLQAALAMEQEATARDLDHRALRRLTCSLRARYSAQTGADLPDDPLAQLTAAAAAVFRSWEAPKAVAYRRLHGLDDNAGTAVTVQTMVFGNAGGASGAGVGFTRDPASGEPRLYLDFCFNGQGEDVVAGRQSLADSDRLRRELPAVYAELARDRKILEAQFHDAQDFEFTVQDGVLFLLQARDAKRTPWAALRIAVDMVAEGLITPRQALARLQDIDLAAISLTGFADPLPEPVARATVAGIGVAAGPIAFDATMAERLADAGTPPILLRPETLTEDIAGLARAAGLLTAVGSRTAHAAVVARQLNKVCLVGCRELEIDPPRRRCRIGDRMFLEGDIISLDGNTGAIYAGGLPIVTTRPRRELAIVANWRREAAA